MPNGGDKNFVRLCGALDGFKVRYGRWPIRVVIYPMSLDDLREHVLSPEAFATVMQKVRLVEGDAGFQAEDGEGNVYDYANEGFPESRPNPTAEEWLGVRVNPDLGW
jgi:hypothetical protein